MAVGHGEEAHDDAVVAGLAHHLAMRPDHLAVAGELELERYVLCFTHRLEHPLQADAADADVPGLAEENLVADDSVREGVEGGPCGLAMRFRHRISSGWEHVGNGKALTHLESNFLHRRGGLRVPPRHP